MKRHKDLAGASTPTTPGRRGGVSRRSFLVATGAAATVASVGVGAAPAWAATSQWSNVVIGDESSDFGPRTDPITGGPDFHNGVDYRAPAGTAVWAAAAGSVITATTNSIRGIYVIVDHGDGVQTLYQHLRSRSVSVGDTVTVGQVVGGVGTTGSSTGNHLHFEVRVDGERIDPVPFMRTRGVTLGQGRLGPVLTTPDTPTVDADDLNAQLLNANGVWYVTDLGAKSFWVVSSSTLLGYLINEVNMPVIGTGYDTSVLNGFRRIQ